MAPPGADQRFWAPLPAIFDFSLTFEQVVMEILPSTVVIALSPLVYLHYRKKPVYVRASPLLWAKLRRGCRISSQEASDRVTHRNVRPSCFSRARRAVTIGAIIYTEHRHAIRTSALLALYLLLGLVIDVVKSRSYFLRPGNAALGALAVATGSLRLFLLVLEEKSRRALLLDEDMRSNASLESTSGFLNRTLFLFLTPMLVAGYQKELLPQHLLNLGLDFSSKLMYETLGKHWSSLKDKHSKYGLIMSCIKAWKYQLIQLFVARLVETAILFAQPFLLQRIIDMVGNHEQGPEANGKRAGLFAATIVVFAGATIAKTAATHLGSRLATQIRGGLVTHVLGKTHSLTEQEARKSSAMTLMSTDVDGIVAGLPNCINIPITLIEIGLGMAFLYFFIGYSCFFVVPPVLFSASPSYLLRRWIQPAAAAWNRSIESRVAKTSNVLAQLPAIKMLGLGPTVTAHLQRLRVDEVNVSKRYRRIVSLSVPLVQFADLMTPVIVVAGALFWKGFDGQVTAAKVFPTLAVVGLVQSPLAAALEAYPTLMSMAACFGRVETFLRLQERQDSRKAAAKMEETVDSAAAIRLTDVSFGPRGMDTPLLQNVDFSIARGSVVGIIGRTGGGKSTMLGGILGETKNTTGSIQVDGTRVSYCSQKVWLRDTTIRANITGYLPYDEEKYKKVIRCCELETDLSQLPNGDQYVVGTDGLNLSGGQRQRVAIARAAYAQFAITLLDDVFSSLDRKTAVSIMHALCGEDGLLRQAGSTVLMVTYLSECLDVVDDLVILEDDGKAVLESKDPGNPAHAKMIHEILSSAKAHPSEEKAKEDVESRRNLLYQDQPETTTQRQRSVRQTGDVRLYLIFIDAVGRTSSVLFSLLIFVLSAGELLPEVYMRMWIETDPENALYFIGYASIAAVTCLVGSLVYFLTYNKFAGQASIRLHDQLLNTTMGSTLAFLSTTRTGVLLNYFSQDATIFAKTLPAYVMRTIYVLYTVAILTGIILSGASYMSISLPFILAAIRLIQHFYLRTSRQMRHLDLEQRAPLYTFFRETAEGLLHIQSAGWQEENMETGFRIVDNSQQPFYLMYCIQRWLGLVTGLLTVAVAVLLVAIALYVDDSTSGSQFGLAFLGILLFNRTLLFFIDSFTQMEKASGALSRLQQFKERTPQESKQSLVALPAGWPAEGRIEIANLTARYRPDEGIPAVLHDISLSIEPGKKVALTGRTGSGKSSVLLSVLGLLPHTGTIKIDGIDITSIPPDTLRSRLVTITQDQVQFDTSVRTNLLPFAMNDSLEEPDDEKKAQRAKTDAELQELLERLGIWSHLQDKGGLEALLTDVGYSQGEVQLMCIARAVLRQRQLGTKVVLVDEATSKIDLSRDATVRRVMEDAFGDCTVLAIAHRNETIQDVDCTIELSNGRIVNAQ